MSQSLSQAFQGWRDPYYAASSGKHPPLSFVRKGSRRVAPVQPAPCAGLSDKILGSYSLSSSDSEEEIHPTQTPPKSLVVQPALKEPDDDHGVTQFEFSDKHIFFPLLS